MLEPRMENSGYEWWSQNWGHLPAATLHRTTPAWPSSGGEGADFGWNGSRVFEIEKNTSQQVGRAFFMNSFKRTRHFDEPQIWRKKNPEESFVTSSTQWSPHKASDRRTVFPGEVLMLERAKLWMRLYIQHAIDLSWWDYKSDSKCVDNLPVHRRNIWKIHLNR